MKPHNLLLFFVRFKNSKCKGIHSCEEMAVNVLIITGFNLFNTVK